MRSLLSILSVLAMVAISQALLPPESRKDLLNEGFRCLAGIRPSRNVQKIMKTCYAKGQAMVQGTAEKYNMDAPTWTMIEEINQQRDDVTNDCLVQLLGYKNSNGTLNTTKVTQDLNALEAPNFVIRYRVATQMTLCLNSTTGVNATQHFANFQACVNQSLSDYCNQEKKMLESYLDRESSKSACASLGVSFQDNSESNLTKAMAECAKQPPMFPLTNATASNSRRNGRQGNRRGGNNNRDEIGELNRELERQTMQILCAMGKLGAWSLQTGMNFTMTRTMVANITGGKENPQVVANLTAAYDYCAFNLTNDNILRNHLFDMCFPPKVVDICGFASNFTEKMIPLRLLEINIMARMYAGLEIGLDSDNDNSMEDEGGSSEEGGRSGNRRDRQRRSGESNESDENTSLESDESNETQEVANPTMP